MAAFDRLFVDHLQGAGASAPGGGPLVGTVCNFVPEELILALGAVPRRMDLAHVTLAEEGERALGAEACATVRALAGAREQGQEPPGGDVDLLVVPAACDGKKKLVQRLEGAVHLMELPQRKDGPRAARRWLEEVHDLAAALEGLTGRKLRRRPLRAAVELLNRRTEAWRRLMAVRLARPGCLAGADAFLVAQASFFAEPGAWIERADALAQELEDGSSKTSSRIPLVLTGSPLFFPDFELLELIEELGGAVLADEMCSATQRLYNPTVLDEGSVRGMMRAVADKALLPCTCPCFVGGQDRVTRVVELSRRAGARGVVNHTLRMCQIYELERASLASGLQEYGLPVLALTSGAGGEGVDPMRTRIEAFLEMLSC